MNAAQLRALTIQVGAAAPVTFLLDGREVLLSGWNAVNPLVTETAEGKTVTGKSKLILLLGEKP